MTRTTCRVLGTLVLLLGLAGTARAQVTAADYDRAMGLRERWMYLTDGVADPATWVDGTTRFYYRKTVKGGFQFVMVDAQSLQRQPAFDHDKLAAALGAATGEKYTGLRLPFDTFRFTNGERAMEITFNESGWTCRLPEYTCGARSGGGGGGGGRGGQPRSFGTNRDTSVAPDNRPRPSPDGKWEAFVSNDNIVVRARGGKAVKALSSDGAAGNAYDPESIVWSPDSTKIAAYRVRPGFRRIVYRVESSPADQVQPKLHEQLYVKPGDAVDLDQPAVFHVEPAKQLTIANDLFPDPYVMSRLAWRADSRTVAFEYTQRGHQAIRIVEVDAASGAARAVVSEEPKTFYNSWRKFSHDVGNAGREILWMSERDGWNHLYLYDGATGKVKNQITRGDWVVRGVTKVDEAKRQVWFSASGMYPGKDPYLVHFYRIDFDGSNLVTLTEADANHDLRFSSDMAYYVDTYSRVDLPTVSELRRTSDRSLVATLEKPDVSALLAAGFKYPGGLHRQGPRDGKTDIWGVIVQADELRPEEEVPGGREHLRRSAQLVRAEDVLAVRGAFVRRQGHRHAGPRRDGIHRRADRRHGHQQPVQGLPRRRVAERRRRRLSGSHPVAQGGGAEVPVLRRFTRRHLRRLGRRSELASAGCCSTRTSTRSRSRSTAATTTAWTRSAGTSSGWVTRSTNATASPRTSTTPAGCRGRCC